MTTPHKIIEEYIFHVPGVQGTVRGRILQRILSSEDIEKIQSQSLTWTEFSWDVSHTDNQLQQPGTYHPGSCQEACSQLFSYMNKFDYSSAKENADY